MTYTEIIERASVAAQSTRKDVPLTRLRVAAEAMFPSVVEELAMAVALDAGHPWRAVLKDVTASLASGDQIPQTGSGGKPIIGVRGSVRDASDNKPLTNSFTLAEIRRLNDNPGTIRKIPVYGYVIVEPRIYHTRPNVKIDVCILDEAAIATAIAADRVPLFPDAEGAYVTALTEKLLSPTAKFGADDQAQTKAKTK